MQCRTPAEVLRHELNGVGGDYEDGELAYLAATTKIELPVRDRLAWRLHKRLGTQGLVVAREWRRADLAILRGIQVETVIESKALYGFDVHSKPTMQRYMDKIVADLSKAHQLAPDADRYALALVTHVEGSVDEHMRGVVKYSAGIAAAVARLGSAGSIRTESRLLLRERLSPLGSLKEVQLDARRVFGLTLRVHGWLIGPATTA